MKKYISIVMSICLIIGSLGLFSVIAADPVDPIQLILVDVLGWDDDVRHDFNDTILKPIDDRTATSSADINTLAASAKAKIDANSSSAAVKALTEANIVSALTAFKDAGTSFDEIGNENTSASGDSVKQIYTKREMVIGYEDIPDVFAAATDFPAVRTLINEKLTSESANNNGLYFATLYLRELAYLNRKLGGTGVTDTYVSVYYKADERFDFLMNPHLDNANKKLIVQASNDLLNMIPTFAASLSSYTVDSSVTGLGIDDADNVTGKFMTFTEEMLNDSSVSGTEKLNFANFLLNVKRHDAVDNMDHDIIHIVDDKVPDILASRTGLVSKNTTVYLDVKYDFEYDAIYYTTDGSDPTDAANTNRLVYDPDKGIVISQAMTVKAYAVKAGYTDSDVATFNYTIRTGGGGGGNYLSTGSSTPSSSPTESPTATPSTPPILDMDNHFAYMQGYPEGDFRPEQNMTRAEAAVMFSRLLVEKMNVAETYENSFVDINGDEWYAQSIAYMVNKGYVLGYPDGNFRPNDAITRAEFAVMASRFDNLAENSDASFSDIEHGYWAASYIGSAVTKGWVTGYPDGTFRPENDITRAEVVTVTNRMLERVADKQYIDSSSDIIKFTDISTAHWAYYDVMEATNGHDYGKVDDVETWTSLK